MLNIEPISAFSDNYIWLFWRTGSNEACVVDPGDAQPVIEALDARGLTLSHVLITHHHFDHVGGLAQLCERFSPVVFGPHNPAIDNISQHLAQGEKIAVFGAEFEVFEVPGHTLDHIAYYHAADEPVLFCGDTLFAGGCGRLFEGDPPMMLNSLDALAALPSNTRVYCAHEYTLANLAFAQAVEPHNSALLQRIATAEQTRAAGAPTVPSDIALELATNPFLRCREQALQDSLAQQERLQGTGPAEVFATVRAWKDNF